MHLISLEQIKEVVPQLDLLTGIEEGFCNYSRGKVVVPPVAEMILDKGEVHIKYGYVEGEDLYVIKVASGFYENPELGLPSSNGLMLLFSQQTGKLLAILLDNGYLTDVRTALAGAVAARHLAPNRVERIGIIGAGTQARLQLLYLKQSISCIDVYVWGRDNKELLRYRDDMEAEGFKIHTTLSVSEVINNCNLIVTTTPSKIPLVKWEDIRPGTHITAVGSDTPEKQELDPLILKHADVLVGDSLEQCRLRGEIHQALKKGAIQENKAVELGKLISGSNPGRSSDYQISVADLTGVAVQDIVVASAVYRALI
jgi:ornithine cyclodeaminase